MNNLFLTSAFILLNTSLAFTQLTVPPDGGNKRAMVSENIGLTDVSIHYSRPAL